jgi:hypothetical protein
MQCAFYIAGKQNTDVPHIQRETRPKICNPNLVNDSRINKRKKHAPRAERGRQERMNTRKERSVQKKHQRCEVKKTYLGKRNAKWTCTDNKKISVK